MLRRVRVIANSVPKSGTHMLMRLLGLFGIPRIPKWHFDPVWTRERSWLRRICMQAPGIGTRVPIGQGVEVSSAWLRWLLRRMPDPSLLPAHVGYSGTLWELLRGEGVGAVCIVRDPRDVVVSHASFLMEQGKKKVTRRPEHRALVALPDHSARMLALLRGHPGTPSVGERFNEFLGWQRQPGVCFVRFEDLVGPAGGGKEDVQRGEIERVAAYLGLELGSEALDAVQEAVYGGTKTFRKGVAGRWREEFGPEHLEAAAELTPILEQLGYPP